jgi:hypothetical protein
MAARRRSVQGMAARQAVALETAVWRVVTPGVVALPVRAALLPAAERPLAAAVESAAQAHRRAEHSSCSVLPRWSSAFAGRGRVVSRAAIQVPAPRETAPRPVVRYRHHAKQRRVRLFSPDWRCQSLSHKSSVLRLDIDMEISSANPTTRMSPKDSAWFLST